MMNDTRGNSCETEVRNEEIESLTLRLINDHRLSLGLPPLIVHPVLNVNSKRHSDHMAGGDRDFGHYGFKRRYSALKREIAIMGYGENLAYNRAADPASTAFCQWLDSPSHRRTVENPSYTHCGLAVSSGENGFYYFTHIMVSFGHQRLS